jgi:hypothetical protein
MNDAFLDGYMHKQAGPLSAVLRNAPRAAQAVKSGVSRTADTLLDVIEHEYDKNRLPVHGGAATYGVLSFRDRKKLPQALNPYEESADDPVNNLRREIQERRQNTSYGRPDPWPPRRVYAPRVPGNEESLAHRNVRRRMPGGQTEGANARRLTGGDPRVLRLREMLQPTKKVRPVRTPGTRGTVTYPQQRLK